MNYILVIGAGGQLGSVLVEALQKKWGFDNIIASDLREIKNFSGNFLQLDATNYKDLDKIVKKYNISEIYHLAAILSAKGEENPLRTWNINMKSLFNVLEVSRLNNVKKVFYPSSIAVFGSNTSKNNTSQFENLTPSTVYGMTKASGENWANYYFKKYDLDVRSLRYPGVIGYQTLPGGGTTDYAVAIYHTAVKNELFDCFLSSKTKLPMIFMDDAIRATIELMNAPKENIKIRTSYNLQGMSFSPEEIYNSIKKYKLDFKINYKPDFRQEIASTWPTSLDDSSARNDWNWKPKYNLEKTTAVMLEKLEKSYNLKQQ